MHLIMDLNALVFHSVYLNLWFALKKQQLSVSLDNAFCAEDPPLS